MADSEGTAWTMSPAGARAIGLRYFMPARELRTFVSSYYFFYADLPHVADVMRADLAQVRFMIAGTGAYRFGDGRTIRTPEVALLGPTSAATRFDVAGPLVVFGIGLLPAGWAALVREDAGALADSVIDAEAIFGRIMADTLDAMRMTPGADQMVEIADMVMGALAQRAADPPLWFTRMTDAWLTGELSPQVDALVAASDMSARQIERLAKRLYGASPKMLARKYRALRSASLLGAPDTHWAEAAGDAFYDQSHFIREFKHFTGLTPKQFQRDPPPVTRLTLGRRTLAGLPPLSLVS